MSWGVNLAGFTALNAALDDLIDIQLGDDVVYVVGTNVEYAIYQEFGTRSMSSQPFLRPAARSVEREMSSVAGNANSVEDAVKLVALEIERRSAQLAPVDTGTLMNSLRSVRIQ